MIGCGDLKAKIVSFQEKLRNLSLVVILEKTNLIDTADSFVNSSKISLANYSDEYVYNTDQSGFTR